MPKSSQPTIKQQIAIYLLIDNQKSRGKRGKFWLDLPFYMKNGRNDVTLDFLKTKRLRDRHNAFKVKNQPLIREINYL
jgi:hypothetical protein